MKARIITTSFIVLGLISGCNTTPSLDDTSSQMISNCCNDENYQSGYYYNGYKENGWRYCVGNKKEYR